MRFVQKDLIYGKDMIKEKIMRLNKKILKNIKKKNINLITIDGVTCSGKSLFAKLLKKKLENKSLDILILSKDLFLFTRSQRINVNQKIKKPNKNQNPLHYNLPKLKIALEFLFGKTNKKSLILKKLYNRKTGGNDFTLKLSYSKSRLIIFEGIYINEDINFIKKPILKILMIEKIYKSLSRKIQRIRDKKISIQLVVTEFVKLHLVSYSDYLLRNNFDISFEDKDRVFTEVKGGKNKQKKYISNFLSKHSY